MMTGKSVKDIDRYQAVLTALLAREDNKFCADCKAKGPRWASWNLGIFVCIRCAGIHRNLGVHISRVKSVNLDQWTQEQIQCVQEMGNAKARRLYEAFLPECFQRPDSDQSVELFIRDKYDKKKYMDKVIDIQRLKKEKTGDIPKEPVLFEKMKPKRDESQQPKSSPKTQSQSVSDLLGLDAPPPSAAASNGRRVPEQRPRASPALPHSYTSLGLFSPPPTAPPPASAAAPPSSSSSPSSSATPVSSSMPRGRAAASVPENLSLFLDPAPPRHEEGTKKLSKDSILSLYGSAPSVHANMAAAHAGRYVNSPQMGYTTSPYGPYHPLAAQGGGMGGAMMTSQMTLIGQQQNGMMGHPQNGIMGAQGGGGAAASAYMAGMPQGMLGAQQNGMMGGVGAAPQQAYGGQQAQQLQWNITQMTQHMAGMNFYGASGMMGYGAQHMGGPAAPGSAHMTGGAQHVWK